MNAARSPETALDVTAPFTGVWGTGPTTFAANATGNGSVGLFVPGTQPTIKPFLFVIEILGA